MGDASDLYRAIIEQGPERALRMFKDMPLPAFDMLLRRKALEDMAKIDPIIAAFRDVPLFDVVIWLLSVQVGGVVAEVKMSPEWRKVTAILLRRGAELMETPQEHDRPANVQ